MSWKSFACLAAIAALAAPAAAQAPTIGLEDRGNNTAALTITTSEIGSLATDLMISFSGGISLVAESQALSMVGTDPMDSTMILDGDGVGIQNAPDGFGVTVDGSIFAEVGLADQGVRTFDLLTFEFADFGTITASGDVAQNNVITTQTDAVLNIMDGAVVLGDANGDGMLDNTDIAAFVLALTDGAQYAIDFPSVDVDTVLDFDMNGMFGNTDIAGFVAALTGPSAAVPEPSSAAALLMISLAGVMRSRRG